MDRYNNQFEAWAIPIKYEDLAAAVEALQNTFEVQHAFRSFQNDTLSRVSHLPKELVDVIISQIQASEFLDRLTIWEDMDECPDGCCDDEDESYMDCCWELESRSYKLWGSSGDEKENRSYFKDACNVHCLSYLSQESRY